MFDTLLSSIFGVGGLIAVMALIFYATEAHHNQQYSKGKRGAEFDHNNGRGLGLLLIPLTLLTLCGCVAIVIHTIKLIISYI
jgi:hypothetical protein